MAELAASPTFVVGETYRRKILHELYKGQEQGGISTPKAARVIFLFTGDSGREYGYRDGYRSDGLFWYTGEGRRGDMKIAGGNRAVLEHERSGKALHLFESLEKGFVRYLGQAICLDFQWETAPDVDGQPRKAIVFQLEILGASNGRAITIERTTLPREVSRAWKHPLKDLRRLAYRTSADPEAPTEQRVRNVYRRSTAVKAYVLRRANGICEGCETPAPFKMVDGTPYLEPHHIRRLADEGPDHPLWVAALCPNCHRRVHHGADGTEFNEYIAKRIQAIEEEVSQEGAN